MNCLGGGSLDTATSCQCLPILAISADVRQSWQCWPDLTISANPGNFCKYPPILADSAKIGGYFQRFSRLTDICRNYQHWRTVTAIVKFEAHLQRLPCVTDNQVITKATSLCGIKKTARSLLLKFNADLLAGTFCVFFNTKRKENFSDCQSISTCVISTPPG
jgi:hypothetical protein